MRKCANFSPYMRRPLVIHDFAPDPSEIPYIWGNIIFFVISVIASKPTACWYYLSLALGKSSKCHTKRRGKRLLYGRCWGLGGGGEWSQISLKFLRSKTRMQSECSSWYGWNLEESQEKASRQRVQKTTNIWRCVSISWWTLKGGGECLGW